MREERGREEGRGRGGRRVGGRKGRLQYGLFLKSIGLSLDDALSFWRAEFTRKIDVDKV